MPLLFSPSLITKGGEPVTPTFRVSALIGSAQISTAIRATVDRQRGFPIRAAHSQGKVATDSLVSASASFSVVPFDARCRSWQQGNPPGQSEEQWSWAAQENGRSSAWHGMARNCSWFGGLGRVTMQSHCDGPLMRIDQPSMPHGRGAAHLSDR